MGQKIVHSWNEIGGWNTMDILFRNLNFTVGPKRNLMTSFTHVSLMLDVWSKIIVEFDFQYAHNLIRLLSSELHWVSIKLVSVSGRQQYCVKATTTTKQQPTLCSGVPSKNSSNRLSESWMDVRKLTRTNWVKKKREIFCLVLYFLYQLCSGRCLIFSFHYIIGYISFCDVWFLKQ